MEGMEDRFRESALLKRQLDKYKVLSIEQHNDKPIVHKLSHQHLYTTFWRIEVESLGKVAMAIADIKTLPVPVLIANFMKELC